MDLNIFIVEIEILTHYSTIAEYELGFLYLEWLCYLNHFFVWLTGGLCPVISAGSGLHLFHYTGVVFDHTLTVSCMNQEKRPRSFYV